MSKILANILLAEDDPNLGTLLCEYLTAKGYQTHLAVNGQEGIDQTRHALIEPAAPERRQHAKRAADDKRDERGDERDADGVARAVDDAGQDVAADLVGAEPVRRRPRREGVAGDLRLAVGRDQRREDGGERIDEDHHHAETRAPRRGFQQPP